jgi:hypothetical protein
MRIGGIRAEELEGFPEYHGRGQGGVRGCRHLPSGIAVFRKCSPHVPLSRIGRELLAELEVKLRERGLIG